MMAEPNSNLIQNQHKNYELKPCPFCGGEAKLVNIKVKTGLYSSGGTFYVHCKVCSITTQPRQKAEDVVKVWNTRIPKERGGGEVSRQHHYMKILPEYYIAVDKGIKTFEIRFNDRNYKVGDILHLQEFCGGQYTSRELTREICYMIDNPDYCKEGFVVLGIKDI